MATGGPPGPYVAVSAGNLTTTFVPGARDTGTTVGGMRVYEMPNAPYEAVTVAWPERFDRVDMVVCPCNTPGDFPQPCGIHYPNGFGFSYPTTAAITVKTYEDVRSLSDEDVRRIAREVVREMVRANHDPGDED
jgi:hypothetical protein